MNITLSVNLNITLSVVSEHHFVCCIWTVYYLIINFFINVASIFASVIVIHISKISPDYPTPEWVARVFLKKDDHCDNGAASSANIHHNGSAGKPHYNSNNVEHGNGLPQTEASQKNENCSCPALLAHLQLMGQSQHEKEQQLQRRNKWLEVAATIDRCCLYIFIVISLLVSIICISLAACGSGKRADNI